MSSALLIKSDRLEGIILGNSETAEDVLFSITSFPFQQFDDAEILDHIEADPAVAKKNRRFRAGNADDPKSLGFKGSQTRFEVFCFITEVINASAGCRKNGVQRPLTLGWR